MATTCFHWSCFMVITLEEILRIKKNGYEFTSNNFARALVSSLSPSLCPSPLKTFPACAPSSPYSSSPSSAYSTNQPIINTTMAPRKPTPARATRKSVLKSILQTVSSLGRVTKSKPPPRPASPSHTTSTTISITKAPLRILLTSITRKYWNLGRVTKSKPLSRLASPSYTYSTSKLTSITVAPLRRVLTSIIRTYSNPGRATRTKSPPHPVKEPSDAYRMRLYDNGLLNLENTPPHLIAA